VKLARRLLLALWAGALVTIGALVTPTLFQMLADRRLAGLVAGCLFRRATFVSVAIGLAVAVLGMRLEPGRTGRRKAGWALAPALLLLVGEFAVRPLLAAARTAGGSAAGAFAIWHGVSSALYVAATAITVGLLVQELRR
jgi:hypothetical protein